MEALHLLGLRNPDGDSYDYEIAEWVPDARTRIAQSDIRVSSLRQVLTWTTRICHTLLNNRCLLRSRQSGCGRLFCRRISATLLWGVTAFVLVSVLNGVLNPSYAQPPSHYQELEQILSSSTVSGRGNVHRERVFIAANIIDAKLIKGAWGRSLLSLVDMLGEKNVFVSIYENDSGTDTRDALHELQQQLPCPSSIVAGDHLSLGSFPTVRLPDGTERVQRISYLAEVRNRLLRPLDPAFAHNESHVPGFRSVAESHFDKLLFLNDVYFSPGDAAQLLFSTNGGFDSRAQYRAACAVDFVNGVMFYDSFVVRDTDGYGMGLMFYPWFSAAGSGTSRKDVLSRTDAVRVRTCWGGMAAFDAAVFRSTDSRMAVDQALSVSSINMGSPNASSIIKFRSSDEAYWEAAECCLIFADIEQLYGPSDYDAGTGVFVNPYIRVAYTQTTWEWLSFYRRFERMFEYLQLIVSWIGYPEYNPRRTHNPGDTVDELVWDHPPTDRTTSSSHPLEQGRLSMVHRQAVPGGFCGQRRMFVMKQEVEKANEEGGGRNWDKIMIPWRPR